MGKKILFLFIILISNNVKSQNFNGGLIGGISSSQVSGDNLSGYNKAGLFLGVFTQAPVSSITNIKMEMNFIQKGSRNPKLNQNGIPDISTSYLEIPISLNYNQNELLSIESGIQTAFLLSAKDNDVYGSVNSDPPFDKTDISAFIGIYYHYSEKMSLNTRLGNSVLPIRGYYTERIFIFKRGQYNTVLSFTIHYII
ncbi:MAG: hypothetical protein CMD22_05305 [Flavobacteriales bacterium]|nr:hypothetical protein [Flavobacteriales bacterium]